MASKNEYNPHELMELLPRYYKHLFPYDLFYRWLSYGNIDKTYFERREFSMTLPGDIYMRYQSFADAADMKKLITDRCPEKIDIGAVFSDNPRLIKQGLLTCRAEEHELVFDIDMTDYDEVRKCCTGAALCDKCWPFLAIAAKILDRALREDFGFEHLFWIYSGRRGIHCWIADERAREMSVDIRASLASYLTVLEGGQYKTKKVDLPSNEELHISLLGYPEMNKLGALDIIDQFFTKLFFDQKQLETEADIKSIINLCSDAELRKILYSKVLYNKKLIAKGQEAVWKEIQELSAGYFKGNEKHGRHYIAEVKLQFCYPRLDIAVTKGINHLLKSPFCVHPKTGRVCIPIDVSTIEKFDPNKVPTVKQLVNEMESLTVSGDENFGKHLAKKTSMKKSIELFEEFVNKLDKEHRANKLNLIEQKSAQFEN